MHPDEHTPTHVFLLPVELYHQIIIFLDVRDVFALRRTCKHFFALTQERSLWSMMFTRLRATQALPCSRTEFTAMSFSQAERVLLTTSKVEASFLHLRERLAHHIPAVKQPYSSMSASACSWRVLTFISDRFILSVDMTAVMIWDTMTLASSSPAVATSPWAHFTLSNLLGHVDCYSALYIAIGRVHADHTSAVIYSVPLPSLEENEHQHGRLHREAEFPLLDNEMLKHMDPHTGRVLLYLPSTSIHIVHWNDGNRRSTISLQLDQLDQAWNGVTSLRFCGPYILCFRVRAVEAYPIPTNPPTTEPLPLLRHRFGPVCFRAVSLSRVRVSHCPSSGDVYTIYMLTNDVYQGMFHYRIRITTAPTPVMSVRVLARGSILPSEPLPLMPGTETRYTLEDIIRRMFVSTWSLGSAGLRGVWVDRQRGSIDRRVVAFTTHPRRLRSKAPGVDEDEDASDEPPTMDGKVVHVISSYDLRDDVTTCAVSEWTGRIALGSRIGAISLL
ncbi:hypothetical protein L210DRAFT_2660735 [Boletus edulis BED1]|uniref:F-box domain-containing protein n=1 Tax=Boletus edulis BED1 TaxID=1328754 RepID=A0AAD4C695_BOLED|nr:hypothetical protein L210DRAFT_2660735 [Boletus edulis BED1]